MYQSVPNAMIVASAQIMLWSVFFASLTSYFDTGVDRYASPILIGILSGTAGGYFTPKQPVVRQWIRISSVYIGTWGLGVYVGWQATAGWQEVAAVATVAALVFSVAFFLSARAVHPWLVSNARRTA